MLGSSAFVHTTEIAAPREDVFAWHERPGAFARLAPGWAALRPLAQAENVRDGQAVLQARIAGKNFGPTWVAQHIAAGYQDGHSFEDRVTSQPWKLLTGWTHTHTFTGDGQSTRITDTISARMPHSLLQDMFQFRERVLRSDFQLKTQLEELISRHGAAVCSSAHKTPVCAITGASGTVGTALRATLTTMGYHVVILVRAGKSLPVSTHELVTYRQWDTQQPSSDLLEDVDVVFHLAGESIGGRFTAEKKQRIRDSRVSPTEQLAQLAAKTPTLRAFVCASAIGIYGHDNPARNMDEQTGQGNGFLAEVVAAWEGSCAAAVQAGVRVTTIRTGIVLTSNGGLLETLTPLFQAGAGGKIASGKQYMSWIGLDDLVKIYLLAAFTPSLKGPINAVAPQPVTNSEFTTVFGSTLRRPTVLPVPAFAPALLLGTQGAQELACADQHVVPAVLQDIGHDYIYPHLDALLGHELGNFPT